MNESIVLCLVPGLLCGLPTLLILVTALMPGYLKRAGRAVSIRTWQSLVLGLASFAFFFAIAALSSNVTYVPLRVVAGLILFILLPLMAVVGMATAARVVGERVLALLTDRPGTQLGDLVVGILCLGIGALLPIVGWVTLGLLVMTGFGAALLALFQRNGPVRQRFRPRARSRRIRRALQSREVFMRGRRFATMCLVFIPLLLATGGVVWATGQSDRSLSGGAALPVPLAIDEDVHHLGDQAIAFFDVPQPEGTVYTVTFTLPSSAVQDSFLRLETYNVEDANPVRLNGIELGDLPGTWWVGWQPTALPVPASALQEGENTLVISSAQFPVWRLFEHGYDDLMFRRLELLALQVPFSDEFADSNLAPRWDWVDLLGDGVHDLTEQPGYLSTGVPTSTTWHEGHDLFWLANFNAPRLLQPVRGDFQIETKVRVDPQDDYQAAGLLVWQDTWHYVRLERNAWWGGSVFGGLFGGEGPGWTFRLSRATELELRLSRVGDTFVGWYREGGATEWTWLGQASAPFADTVLVGLAVYNQGSMHPTSAQFDYWRVTQVVPPVFTTPCGMTNQTRPVLRGLATPGTQVRLYADGSKVATTTATVEGTFAISPTVALPPGGHTLTATVTSGGEVSSPSSELALTVAPDEAVDLVGFTISHQPWLGEGPPITSHLRNRDGCAACDGTGFSVWVPGGKPITVSVPVSATEVTSVEVRIGDVAHALEDPDGDGLYEGTFTPPSVRGLASLEFVVVRAGGLVIEYACGEIIIDPYGTVYDADRGPAAPISGARVTLYQWDAASQDWVVWTPTGGQENPQTTGSDGRYAFNVPEGMYYVAVEARGYQSYASQPTYVTAATGPVELLVPLKRDRAMDVYLPLVFK